MYKKTVFVILVFVVSSLFGVDIVNLQKGIELHDLAEESLNQDYVDQGLKILEKEYKDSGSYEALAYFGSLQTIESNILFLKGDLTGSLDLLNKGSENIDYAVEMDPDNVSIRFLRVINGLEVSESSPVNRMEAVLKDIEFLDSKKEGFSSANISMFYLYSGKYYLMDSQIDLALNSFERCIRTKPESDYAKEANKLLLIWSE